MDASLQPVTRSAVFWLAALLVVAATVAPNATYFRTVDRNADIAFIFRDSLALADGGSPYTRILQGDMRTNDKYSTYFPLFYCAAALTQNLGLRVYGEWLAFWRVVFAGFDVAIALLLLTVVWRRGLAAFALFAALFWAWNRWTLFEVLVAQIDFIPIFFLLLALVLLERRPDAAMLLLGVSLAAKQIAIFLVPLFLIHAWSHAVPELRPRAVVRALLLIGAVPLAFSLPFLWSEPEAYVRSILFSATRLPRSHFGAPSIDEVVGLVGLPAKIPMLGLMGIVYAYALGGRVGMSMASLLVMSVFVDFNSVLYTHYPCWVVPLLVLAACDAMAPAAAAVHDLHLPRTPSP
ncbi:hypothetical protein K2Z84_33330 [Candidatus Binatia bacterium]|jgi:hypothetical protein|nr:hypothetical protein [Candidatus Binatia bacterium]